MALIRIKKNWKDLIESGTPHMGISRRAFMERGLATATLSALAPTAILSALTQSAQAANCPPQVRMEGGLFHLYRSGGPTMGAMCISEIQATAMSVGAADNYGVDPADMVEVGQNFWVSSSSPFGAKLLETPAGYADNAAWRRVLRRCKMGSHCGAYNKDDGNGDDSMIGASIVKRSFLGTDLRLNAGVSPAPWAFSEPFVASNRGGLSATNLANNFGMTPANGTSQAHFLNTASASEKIAGIFASIVSGGRKYASEGIARSSCQIQGNAVRADSATIASLFDINQIPALTGVGTGLSTADQVMIASAYQCAKGTLGMVFATQGGCDYHQQSVQNTIAPNDIEAATILRNWIVACDKAGTRGAFFDLGQWAGHCQRSSGRQRDHWWQ